jgi:hypothetical protein
MRDFTRNEKLLDQPERRRPQRAGERRLTREGVEAGNAIRGVSQVKSTTYIRAEARSLPLSFSEPCQPT